MNTTLIQQVKSSSATVLSSKLFWPLLSLLLLLSYSLITDPDFFSIQIIDDHFYGSLIDILNRGAPAALLALGMMVVIATGGIDLSVGAIIAIAGATSAYMITQGITDSIFLIVIGTLVISAFAGLWNGFLVSVLGIQPFIATLILMVSGRGVAQLITDGQILVFHHKAFDFIGGGFVLGLPFSILIVAVFYVFAGLILRKTALGLFIESIGSNATASYYVGIQDRTLRIIAYVFSGICAGVAGMIIASNIHGADSNNAGLWSELDAILAVVIGGTAMTGGRFYIIPTLIGVLILQTLTTTILSSGLPVQFTQIVKAIVVVLVMLIMSPAFRKQLAFKKKQAQLTPRQGDHHE